MRLIALMAAMFLFAVTAGGEEPASLLSKFSIHGYISQAYAVSEDHEVLGIPTGGTVDYRDLALQLRYDANAKSSAVVQFRHTSFGNNPREQDAVELDWAFYQHNVSDRLSLKAGRIPLPLGIFNEAGGPAGGSPFFRPPVEFYERRYSSKTVDGALASLSLGDSGGWSFDVDAYGGRWEVDHGRTESADARDAWGAQVWANTPWTGVRIGAGAYRCAVDPPAGENTDYLMLHASVEADLDRWRLASEFIRGNLDTNGSYRAWYAQAGYQFTPRLSVHARGSVARRELPEVDNESYNLSEDLGLAVNFAVHRHVIFKLEGHTNAGFPRENRPFDVNASPLRTRYLIASITATY